MSLYKGIGYDAVTAKTRTGTAADTIRFEAAVDAIASMNVLGGLTADFAQINGNLTVEGEIISRNQENVVIQDPMIDLGVGATGPQTTGFDFTVAPSGTSSDVDQFVAGVAGVSAPVLKLAAAPAAGTGIVAGQVVMVWGSTEASNDGFYIVDSIQNTTDAVLKGIGGTALTMKTPWVQNQVTGTDAGETAKVQGVDLKVLAVAPGGLVTDQYAILDAAGQPYPAGLFIEAYYQGAMESDFTANGGYNPVGSQGVTLQDAYDNSATVGQITTVNGKNIYFDMSAGGAIFRVDGGSVDFGNAGQQLNNFNVDAGGIGLSASDVAITAGNTGLGALVLHATDTSGSIRFRIANQQATAPSFEVYATGAQVRGTLTVDANTILGDDAAVDTVDVKSRFISDLTPSSTDTYSLGTSSLRWLNLHAQNISMENATVSTLTDKGIVYSGPNGELLNDPNDLQWDSTLKNLFNVGDYSSLTGDIGTASGDISTTTGTITGSTVVATTQANLASAAVTDLTIDRIVFVGANSELIDSDDYRFNNGLQIGGTGTEKFSVAVLTGNTETRGTLVVDGLSSLDGGIDVNNAQFTVDAASGDVYTKGALTVTTDTILNGAVDLGSAPQNKITFIGEVDSDIIPDTDLAYDLGSATKRWNQISAGAVAINNFVQDRVVLADASGNLSQDVEFRFDQAYGLQIGGTGLANTKFTVEHATGNTLTQGTLEVHGLTKLNDDLDLNKAGLVNVTHKASAGAHDLVIQVLNAGVATDSSVVLRSEGTGTDAVRLETTANDGGITLNSINSIDIIAAKSFDISSTKTSSIGMQANDPADQLFTIGAVNTDPNAKGDMEIAVSHHLEVTAQTMDILAKDQGLIATFNMEADTNGLSKGAAAYMYHDGAKVVGGKANADTVAKARFMGVAYENAAPGDRARIVTEGVVDMVATSNVAIADMGKEVYLSKVNGQVTLDVSAFVNGDTIYRVGYIVQSQGTTPDIKVLLAPQFIMELG